MAKRNYEIRIKFSSPEISVIYGEWIIHTVKKSLRKVRWFNDPTREIELLNVTVHKVN